jgi:hypothetical protein
MGVDGVEHELLGQLILSPQLLESCEELGQDLFTSADRCKAFAGISALWEELRPGSIDPGILAAKSGLSAAFIADLISGNFRPDPVNFTWRVREIRLRRAGERLHKLSQDEGQHLVKTGEHDPAKLQEYKEVWREIEDLTEGKGLDPAKALKTGAELQDMDIKVEYDVDKLAPCRSLINFYGPSGLGKTWAALGLSKSVSQGTPFLGLATRQRPVVYVDFENPLPMLIDRVRKLDIRDVRFWHLSAEVRPPRLDGPDWGLYKALPAGSFLVFDTLRASHGGDENSSQDAELVMGRLKELRELDHTIIVIHHTTKVDGRIYKGSSAWVDLADHTISFHRVKKNTLEEIDDAGFDPDALLALGTGSKTRFEPFHMFLTLDAAAGGFQLAGDPGQEELDAIRDFLTGSSGGATQTEVSKWAKDSIEIAGKGKLVALLKKGEKVGLWKSRVSGRSRYYVAS